MAWLYDVTILVVKDGQIQQDIALAQTVAGVIGIRDGQVSVDITLSQLHDGILYEQIEDGEVSIGATLGQTFGGIAIGNWNYDVTLLPIFAEGAVTIPLTLGQAFDCWEEIDSNASSPFVDSDVIAGGKHYYRIRNADGDYLYSNGTDVPVERDGAFLESAALGITVGGNLCKLGAVTIDTSLGDTYSGWKTPIHGIVYQQLVLDIQVTGIKPVGSSDGGFTVTAELIQSVSGHEVQRHGAVADDTILASTVAGLIAHRDGAITEGIQLSIEYAGATAQGTPEIDGNVRTLITLGQSVSGAAFILVYDGAVTIPITLSQAYESDTEYLPMWYTDDRDSHTWNMRDGSASSWTTR